MIRGPDWMLEPAVGARVTYAPVELVQCDAVVVAVPHGPGLVHVLAVHQVREPGIVCMPGGKVEVLPDGEREHPREAALRELREETGVAFDQPGLLSWIGAVEHPTDLYVVGIYLAPYFTDGKAPREDLRPNSRLAEPDTDPQWVKLEVLAQDRFGRYSIPAKVVLHRFGYAVGRVAAALPVLPDR